MFEKQTEGTQSPEVILQKGVDENLEQSEFCEQSSH